MKYNFIEIGNRITEERMALGWSQDKLIEELSYKGVKIGRNSLSDIENGNKKYNNFSLKLLAGLAELFDCEIGYLLCEREYQCKTRCDTDIYIETGLNERSINTLRSIQKQDENENAITLFPSKLFSKIKDGEKLTSEERKQMEEMFLDDSGKYTRPLDSNRPRLMDLFNYILNHYNSMEELLMTFRNLLNPFTVPVFFDKKAKKWFYPDNDYSKINLTYTINLAKDEQHPSDNLPLWIDNNFLNSVNLKSIENIFRQLCRDYSEDSNFRNNTKKTTSNR